MFWIITPDRSAVGVTYSSPRDAQLLNETSASHVFTSLINASLRRFC
jgi:hypothetical protein